MITYSETKNFEIDEIRSLFLSVNWESGKYPEKLVRAVRDAKSLI